MLLVVLIGFFYIQNPLFLTQRSALATLSNIAVLGLVTLGQTGVLIGGGFDLSVGGAVALGAVVCVSLLNAGVGYLPAIAMTVLIVGVLVGGINAIAVTRFGINPLIATLAMLSITGGVANTIANGLAIRVADQDAVAILANTTIGPIPNYLWLVLASFLAGGFVLGRTTLGRSIYFLGGNSEGARLAGLRVTRLTASLYVNCAALAALAGCVTVSQLSAGSPAAGRDTTLLSITAVVIGGGSLQGGTGGALGALMGVLVLGTLSTGLAVTAVPTFYRDIATGAVLLLAVGVNVWRSRRLLRGE